MAINTKEMWVDESVSYPGQFYWSVYSSTSVVLATGYTSSKDQAIRNARNFIRHNQNAVYG